MSYSYRVYGLTVSSQIPLSLPEVGEGSLATVTLSVAEPSFFAEAVGFEALDVDPNAWFEYVPLRDGRSYVRGWGLGEFLVSADGRQIVCHCLPTSSVEAFQVYLLGQALSFSLLKLGFEPLHATAVVVNGRAVALLGESGAGKSTLAACFVGAGYPILTDDVLLVHQARGAVMAYPGPPRLKLFPKVAGRFVSDVPAAPAMNARTLKQVLSLDAPSICDRPVPLGAVYAVRPPRGVPGHQDVRIDPITGHDAVMTLVKATFNQRFVNRARLARQFEASTRLAELLPIKRLSYPRVLARLPQVMAAVLADASPKPKDLTKCVH